MNIQFYDDFIEYTDEELDTEIKRLETELDSIDFNADFNDEVNEKERHGILSISREKGKGFQVKSDFSKTIQNLKRLLQFLGLKKKKLKQQGKPTDAIDARILNIKKKLK